MFLERLHALDQIRVSEAEAKMAREEAERATNAKSEFFATMSHEIRTPLNSIIGYTSLVLARQGLSREDTNDLSIVRDAGKALLAIVNDILDFSAIEAGRLKFIKSSVTLPPLIEGCVALFFAEGREKGLDIRSEIDPDLNDLTFTADAHRLRQVLLNLVNNAVKFTSQGSVVVGATILDREEKSANVRFFVRDTGPGIRADLIPNLFQRFSQLDNGRDRRGRRVIGNRRRLGLEIHLDRLHARNAFHGLAHGDRTKGTIHVLDCEGLRQLLDGNRFRRGLCGRGKGKWQHNSTAQAKRSRGDQMFRQVFHVVISSFQ